MISKVVCSFLAYLLFSWFYYPDNRKFGIIIIYKVCIFPYLLTVLCFQDFKHRSVFLIHCSGNPVDHEKTVWTQIPQAWVSSSLKQRAVVFSHLYKLTKGVYIITVFLLCPQPTIWWVQAGEHRSTSAEIFSHVWETWRSGSLSGSYISLVFTEKRQNRWEEELKAVHLTGLTFAKKGEEHTPIIFKSTRNTEIFILLVLLQNHDSCSSTYQAQGEGRAQEGQVYTEIVIVLQLAPSPQKWHEQGHKESFSNHEFEVVTLPPFTPNVENIKNILIVIWQEGWLTFDRKLWLSCLWLRS